MRNVPDVRASSSPNNSAKILLMVVVPAVCIGLFAVGFIDPATIRSEAMYRLVVKLQELQAGLFIAPVVRHPWFALGLAVLAAYSGNLALIIAELSTKPSEPGPFKSDQARHAALYLVPLCAAVGAVAVFVGLVVPGGLGEPPLRFWTCAVFSGLLAVAACLTGSWTAHRRRVHTVKELQRQPDAHDLEDLSGAARAADVSDLLIQSETWPEAPPDRIVIGRFMENGKETNLWVAPHIKRMNQTMVVAPPGSGKTYSIALPWSRELPLRGQSVFSVDVKGNMRGKLLDDCEKASVPLYVFDPSDHTHSIHWNPFTSIDRTDSTDFHNGRDRLADAIFGEVSRGDNQYFDLRDLRLIKAGIELLLIRTDKMPVPRDLYALFLSQSSLVAALTELKARSAELKRRRIFTSEDERLIHQVNADLLVLSDKEEQKEYSFSELIQGIRNKLEPFGQPAVTGITDMNDLKVSDKPVDFSLRSLIERPSVFLCSTPLSLGVLGTSIAAVMVRMMQHEMTKRFQGASDDHKLFMILDEFSKLRLQGHQLEDFISTSREARCVSVVILQDITQLAVEIRLSILSNCKDVYILRGAGPPTATWFSQVLDTRRRLQASLSENQSSATKSESAGLSASISEQWVPVLRPREIRSTGGLKYGAWLLLDDYSYKPILVDLNRHPK